MAGGEGPCNTETPRMHRFWDSPQVITMPPGLDIAMTAMKLADALLVAPEDEVALEVIWLHALPVHA